MGVAVNLHCCDSFDNLDISKMELPWIPGVRFADWELWQAALCIVFNPLYWNLVARCEQRYHWLTWLCGSARRGIVFFAVTIMLLGIYRDLRFSHVVQSQPHWHLLQENSVLWSGYGLILLGTLLVFSSFTALGFYAMFLGDYFDVHLVAKVTSFPYNLIDHPMYIGSTLNFLGLSLVHASQAGLLLTILVAFMYSVSAILEGTNARTVYKKTSKEKIS